MKLCDRIQVIHDAYLHASAFSFIPCYNLKHTKWNTKFEVSKGLFGLGILEGKKYFKLRIFDWFFGREGKGRGVDQNPSKTSSLLHS